MTENKGASMTLPEKALLTFQETCEFLQIKASRLRTAIFRKEIPYIKIGRLLRFDPKDLKEWIERLKQNNGN